MERSDTTLKLFKKIMVRKVEMKLRSDSFFKNLGEKWKIGFGTEDVEVTQICTRFPECWVTAAVLRGEGRMDDEGDDRGRQRVMALTREGGGRGSSWQVEGLDF